MQAKLEKRFYQNKQTSTPGGIPVLNLKALTLAVVVGLLSPVVPINVLNVPQVLAQTQEEQRAKADRLYQQGIQQGNAGSFQESLQSFQQALKIYQEIGDRQGEASSLYNLGNIYRDLGQYQKAIEFYQQSLAIAKEVGYLKREASSLNNMGLAYDGLEQYQKAIELFQESLVIKQEIGDRQGAANSFGNLGNTYLSLEQYHKGIEFLQKQLVITREIGDSQGEANALRGLGLAYSSLEQFQQAIEFYQQSLKLYPEIGDRQGEASSLNDLGEAYRKLGQYQKAIELYQQSLLIKRELGDRRGEAGSLNNLGLGYGSFGQYQTEIEFLQQSLKIDQELGDRRGEAGSLNNLGEAYRKLGQYQKAIELYQQSLKIDQELGDRRGEAGSLNNLGIAYGSLGQYQTEIEFLQQSLKIDQELGHRHGEALSLSNLGIAYKNLGQYEKAIEFHQQSLAIKQEIEDRAGEGASLGNLGVTYGQLGQYQKAMEYHQQSLAIAREIGDRQGEAKSLRNLGSIYSSLRQYQKAIEFDRQSLTIKREIGDRQGEATSLNGLGIAYRRLGQYHKAIEFYQRSLVIQQEIGDLKGEANSLKNLGIALLITDKPREAEVELRKAIDVYESLRTKLQQDQDKVSIFDSYLGSFHVLQEALVAQDKTDAALEISEQGRARSLVELMSERLNNNQQDLVSTIEPPNLQQIRQIAKNQNATFVQYSVVEFGDDAFRLYIWVIKPTGEITFKEVDLSDLDTPLQEIIDNSRIEDIGARGRNQYDGDIVEIMTEEFLQEQQAKQTANLRQLHDLLIKPIADLLPTDPSEKVVFMPQGELYLVPFPALMDEQNQYLIEKHTILTAPSIQLLDIARKSHNEKRNNPASEVLIVGNPTMPEVWHPETDEMRQLSALMGAEDEAYAIADKLQTEPLVWDQATEPIVTQKMQNARLIHLATHGLLEYGIPEESGVLDAPGAIALAPAGDADGLLTSAEIYNMNLQAELVVLSACDTGRGKISGDGVIGLSRAFLQAGVPSLIVSLWKVPDESTQFLMTKFYDYWQGDMDKVTALRQAILDTKEKYPQPINWAAFTLVGEAQ